MPSNPEQNDHARQARTNIICGLLLFVGPFVYYFLTFSTIPSISLIAGLVMGAFLGSVSLVLLYLVGRWVAALQVKWCSPRNKIVIVSALALAWISAGWHFSRPSVMFKALFFDPMPSFISVSNAAGVALGVDGTLWVFTCNMATDKVRSHLASIGYSNIRDTKAESYWRARFKNRAGAEWELSKDYEIFLLKSDTDGVERWAFVSKDKNLGHFAYCTFYSGL